MAAGLKGWRAHGRRITRGEDYENASYRRRCGASADGWRRGSRSRGVIVTPEQDTVVREYVKKQPLASVKVPGVELNVGTALPDTVEIHEIPKVKYRYVVIDNRTVLVDPGTHKIVKVYN